MSRVGYFMVQHEKALHNHFIPRLYNFGIIEGLSELSDKFSDIVTMLFKIRVCVQFSKNFPKAAKVFRQFTAGSCSENL